MTDSETPKIPEPQIYNRDDHTISRGDIDADALKIMYRLERSGHKGYLVGGGVRDLLLNKVPKDFDIATDAPPKEIKSLFRNSRIIGRRYKLVHIFYPSGKAIEVSTFRDLGVPVDPSEVLDTAAPIVTRENTYGTEATDALRRDLTINALFYDAATLSIIDYVGGMRDLQDKVIRVIGDPDVRFVEDPVRLIRVARHAARNSFTIEERTRTSVLKNFHLIARASQVRVFDELKKDLTSKCSLQTLRLLAELRILEPLMPELLQKDGMLLSDVSELSRCLQRVDTLAAEGTPITSSAVLSLLMLFVQGLSSQRKDIYSWFSNEDEISELAWGCFKYLSVPKKERERIYGTLSAWHELGPPPFSREQVHSLRRMPGFEDLPLLVRFLSDDEDSEELLRHLRTAPPDRRQQDRRQSGSPRGRGGRDGRRRSRSQRQNDRF